MNMLEGNFGVWKKLTRAMPIHKLRKFPFLNEFRYLYPQVKNLITHLTKIYYLITSDALNFVVNIVVTQYCVYYEIQCIRRYLWCHDLMTRLPKGILDDSLSVYYKIKGPRLIFKSETFFVFLSCKDSFFYIK